jgi:hypothetical protein
MGNWQFIQICLSETSKGKARAEDLGIDNRIILTYILAKEDVMK